MTAALYVAAQDAELEAIHRLAFRGTLGVPDDDRRWVSRYHERLRWLAFARAALLAEKEARAGLRRGEQRRFARFLRAWAGADWPTHREEDDVIEAYLKAVR